MIYSKGRNYLLTHAPKTGGTALMLALEARAMADDIIVGDTPKGKAAKEPSDGGSALEARDPRGFGRVG